MTPRQKDLLDFIRQRFAETGIAPSFEEMAGAVNVGSKSNIYRMVAALEEQGLITRTPRRARSIQLVDRTADISDADLARALTQRGYLVHKRAGR